jgi:hypothetical protein
VFDLTDQSPPNKIDSAMAYVRVVLRQRIGRGESPADIRWRRSSHGRQICNRKHREKQRRRALRRQTRNEPDKPAALQSWCPEISGDPCDCGAPYVSAGQRAAEALKANPEKSNRSIADDIGVSEFTVRKARKKSTSSKDEVEKRIGRDGKEYVLSRSRRLAFE